MRVCVCVCVWDGAVQTYMYSGLKSVISHCVSDGRGGGVTTEGGEGVGEGVEEVEESGTSQESL